MVEKLKEKFTLRNILVFASLVLLVVGFIIYLVTATTGYYVGKKPNTCVVVCSILFIITSLAFIAFDDKIGKFDTIGFFLLACFVILSFVFFVLDKEEVVGEMMIPVNHPQKQIDAATSTIVGVVFYGLSFVLLAVSSFLDFKPRQLVEVEAK